MRTFRSPAVRFALGLALLALAGCEACPTDPTNETDSGPIGPGIPVFDAGTVTPPTDGGFVPGPDGGEAPDSGVGEDSGVNTGIVGIESITPATGVLTGGGPRLTIVGWGFTPPDAEGLATTHIFIGGTECLLPIFISDTRITCALPPGAVAGPVDVRAENPNGIGLLETGFTYFSPVEITSLVPATGTTEGGTLVEAFGVSFSPQMVVLVGGRRAVGLTVDPDGLRATFLTPPGRPGRTDVEAVDAFGRSVLALGFTYTSPLVVTEVDPPVYVQGSTPQLEIKGAGFDPSTVVNISGFIAPVENFVDETLVVVRAPVELTAGAQDVTVYSGPAAVVLDDGLFVLPAPTGTAALTGVVPAAGDALGGQVVTLVGEGLSTSTAVTFGGVAATSVVVLDDRRVQATTPAGVAGAVDVVVTTGAGDLTLTFGFTYQDRLHVNAIAPASGPAAGGTPVAITGSGFAADATVTFGGVPATDVVVVDGLNITATAPAGTAGPVDVVVAQAGARASLRGGFRYDAELSILGVRPSRGGFAGGTFVTITGSGFTRGPAVVVLFGEIPALPADTVVVSDSVLTTRTPFNAPGVVNVSVIGEDGPEDVDTEIDTDIATRAYTYFDPTMLVGGTRGGAIEGALYVTALDAIVGMPIPDLPVYVGTDGEGRYLAKTNLFGQATLSGPDLFGPQTVSVTGDGYEYATVVDVNASEITLYLFPLGGGPPGPPGPGPPPPPPAQITGRVTGFAKELFDPAALGPDEIALAVIVTTARDEYSGTPDPGGDNIVFEEGGSYHIANSRPGRLALVALAGIFNLTTGEFRMRQMGVRREVYPEFGVTLVDQDIELTIPLDQEVEISMPDAPLDALPDPQFGAPDITRVIPFLRFGGEGSLAYTDAVEAVRNHDIDAMPDVPGEMLTFIAGAYTTYGQGLVTKQGLANLTLGSAVATGTGTNWDIADPFTGAPLVEGAILVATCADGSKFASTVVASQGSAQILLDEKATCTGNSLTYHIGNPSFPSSEVIQDGVGDLRGGVTIQPVLGLPEALAPLPNGVLEHRTIRWKAAAGQQPTIHQMYIYEALSYAVFWTFYVDGARTKVVVPKVPAGVSTLGLEALPSDLVPGGYAWQHESIFTPGLDFDNWSYFDISTRGKRAWTTDVHLFIYGSDD